jgi:hypothetical protein
MTTLAIDRAYLGTEPQAMTLPPEVPDLRLWQVHEGPENHVVIAFDAAQARGIAFGHRFADPDEWGDEPPTMTVAAISHKTAMRIALEGEPGEMPTTLAFELGRAAEPTYLGGSVS